MKTIIRSPETRLKSILILPILVFVWCFNNSIKVLYHFSFSAERLILPNSFTEVKNVSAEYDFSANDLMSGNVINSIKGQTSPMKHVTFGSFDLPIFLLLIFASIILCYLAIKLDSITLVIVSFIILNISRSSLDNMNMIITSNAFGGNYISATSNLQNIYNSIYILFFLFIAIGYQVYVVRKEKGIKSSFFKTLLGIQSNYITNMVGNTKK